MKFFSKAKHTAGSGKKSGDSAASGTPAENDIRNVGDYPALKPQDDSQQPESETSCPQTSLSALAKRLGISNAGDIEPHGLTAGNPANGDERIFLDRLTDKAQALLLEMDAAEKESSNADGEKAPEARRFSSDMCLETYISKNGMKAYGFVFPPIGGGNSLGLEQLRASAKNDGIVCGLNEELLNKLAGGGDAMKPFVLAEGKASVDGVEGQVTELYSRERQISLNVDDDEKVDYKNLNWLQTVHKGDVICRISPPVPAQDGFDVRGNAVKGREPKALRLPKGKNIAESEDHTELIAEVDGHLIFLGGIFKVEQLLRIDGDVDSSIGNLDVIGSVNVRGCVFDGFTVKATGDIVVTGRVEGAELDAGGNIKIVGGTNGSFKGKLTAGGSISSKYLENCTVTAAGPVTSESIINSTVVSSGTVITKTGKGVIVGSTVISLKGVEAKVIGNDRNLPTKITVGTDPKLSEELTALKKEVPALVRQSEETEKNIRYLKRAESLTEVYRQLLERLQKDYSEMADSVVKKSHRIAVLEDQLKGDDCQIIANQIFPPLTVSIGTITKNFLTESRMSRIFKSEGEIVLGKK